MTTAAIMQPTFLPWMGYFALIDRADRFLFLDDVQLSRQSWQTRNRLKGPDGPVMLSLPVARKPSTPLLAEARLADTGFETKLLATLRQLLARAPFRDLATDIVAQALATAEGRLADLNIAIIEAICIATGIDTPRQRSSDLVIPPADKVARLVALCRAVGAGAYLSPLGAWDYLAGDTAFETAGITLAFQSYQPAEYPQPHPPFVSHLSALDALAQVGPDAFLSLVRAGNRPDLAAADLAQSPRPALGSEETTAESGADDR